MGKPQKSAASTNEEQLHTAARNGDLNAVKSTLSSNPLAVNSRDKHSRTPLHLAAWAGQAEVVSYLCKNKADVGAAAMDDMGAIHFAAQKGHLEVVRTLCASGVSVKACNRKGFTPLHYAVQGSHLELIKYLVRKGASLTAKTKAGKTPADLASTDEVRHFLEECERSKNKGSGEGGAKPDGSDQKPLSDTEPENSIVDSSGRHDDEQVDDKVKRKADVNEAGATSQEAKKAKVALSHLISADDTQEDEEQ